MRVRKLILDGFSGIESGLGRNRLELDINQLADDAALVALVGPNGSGKSTIMDNLHPYRVMPSRSSGSYSPSAFSFYDNLCAPEALKELEWEAEGHRYRSTLAFKVAGSKKKTDAYLHEWRNGSWVPATLPDGTVSDGKTDTYDRLVEGILGSPETFFTSAFSAQNRRPLSAYANGEIKSLMADLLGLEHLREIGQQAAQVVKSLKSGLVAAQADLSEAQARKEVLDSVIAAVKQSETAIAELMTQRDGAQTMVEQSTQALAAITAKAELAAESAARRNELLARVRATEAEREAAIAALDEQHNQTVRSILRKEQNLAQEQYAAQQQVADAERQIEKYTGLLSRGDEIRQASTALQNAEADERDVLARLEHLRSTIEEVRQQELAIAKSERELAGMGEKGKQLASEAKRVDEQSALVDAVPCRGMDLQNQCSLLAAAVMARQQKPVIIATLEEVRRQYRSAKDAIGAQRQAIAEQSGLAGDLRDLESRLSGIRAIKGKMTEMSGLLPMLENAESEIVQWRTRKAESQSLYARKSEELQAAKSQSATEIAQHANAIQQLKSQYVERLTVLSKDLEAVAVQDYTQIVENARQELSTAKQRLTQTERNLRDAEDARAAHIAKLSELQEQLKDLPALQARVERIAAEVSHWTLLAKAFGNDGIIALSIDDAGPTLTAHANDLLLSSYGPRFTVSIKTQTETAKGELREGFDVVVFDADSATEKSVSAMSGGERVWINEALTRAIALYLAQESGRQYETLFSDEADGPLDPERKRMYMAMKREVLRLGGYRQEFFVSQTPELWEMADAVISMDSLRQ